MQKNFILFMVLTFIFTLLYFTFIVPKFFPESQITKQSQNEQISKNQTKQSNQNETPNINKEETNKIESKNDELVKKEIIKNFPEKLINLENENILATFSSIGGKLIHFELKNFKSDKISNNNMIINNKKEPNISPLESCFISLNNMQKVESIDFEVIEEKKDRIVFRKVMSDANNNPIEFIKIITLGKDDLEIDLHFNGLNNNIPILNDNNYINFLSWGYTLGPSDIIENRNNKQEVSFYFGDTYKKLNLKDRNIETINNYKWISVSNLYFTFILKRNDTLKYNLYLTQFNKNEHEIIIAPQKFELIKNEYKINVYFLPKKRSTLSSIDKSFTHIVNYGGILNPIVIFFNAILEFLYKFIKNYGIAIILVSLLIKIVLYPLTRKSIISMKKMAELSPKIQEIQNRNKNNPQKAQIELSELYKKEGVSPLSGCLPILLQLPFLIAFYNSIIYNLNLRNAKFLWIKDLSSPDVLFKLNFSIPFIGNEIRLLPIIMIIVSIVQTIIQSKGQVYTTQEQKTQSQIMSYLMPILFFFLFYNFSSGLVLYWTTQNIFSIIENYITNINNKKS
ncbi:MAG: membrane protein insertase YidC [Spirochaetes bacterium]|nr:membrane protein insertase YidC [Spirochaetota bacterium]